MPKLKTHKGAAKRFKKTGTGKVKRSKAYLRHILTSKAKKRKRHFRSPSLTSVDVPKWRLRFFAFEVRMWRRYALLRFTFPVPVFLKRFEAPLCVFSLGIKAPAFSN